MLKNKHRVELTALIVVTLVLSFLILNNVFADAENNCSDVSLVFARGSGQLKVDDLKQLSAEQPQTHAFLTKIDARLPDNMEIDLKQIAYDAVPVGLGNEQTEKNLVSAEWGWAGRLFGGEYNDSVLQGEELTKSTIRATLDKCGGDPNFRLILGGYSQGAQVMGNVLDDLSPEQIDRVAYVGLFGDPKFKGDSFAARGSVKSEDGDYVQGVLESRNEFPHQFRNKLTNWCRAKDGFCQDSYTDIVQHSTETHSQSYQDWEIPRAALGAAQKLDVLFPYKDFDLSAPEIDTSLSGKLDLMLVIDARDYANTRPDTYSIRGASEGIIDQIRYLSTDAQLGFVAFHKYLPRQDGYHFTYQSLTPNLEVVKKELKDVRATGKDSLNNAALQQALASGWRSDAKKVIINVANLYPGPDDDGYSRLDQALSNATAQNVAIYSVAPEHAAVHQAGLYSRVTETGGLPFYRDDSITLSAGHSVQSMLRTFAADRSIYRGQRYHAAPGEKIQFNLTGFNGIQDREDIYYHWYFEDGDEASTDTPVVEHTYNRRFNGLAQAKIRKKKRLGDSTLGLLTIPVKVGSDQALPPIPQDPYDLLVEIIERANFWERYFRHFSAISVAQSEPTQSIRLSWKLPEGGEDYRYKIWAPDGALLGITAPGQTSVTIHDVPASVDLKQIGISAVGPGGSSERTTTTEVQDKTSTGSDNNSISYNSKPGESSSQRQQTTNQTTSQEDGADYISPANPSEGEQQELNNKEDDKSLFSNFSPREIAANPGSFWSQLGLVGKAVLVVMTLGSVVVAWVFVFRRP